MTKLIEWLSVFVVSFSTWIALLTGMVPFNVSHRMKEVIWPVNLNNIDKLKPQYFQKLMLIVFFSRNIDASLCYYCFWGKSTFTSNLISGLSNLHNKTFIGLISLLLFLFFSVIL